MFASFSSKILLFGEYSIVAGGKALAIPYSKYHGHFAFANENLEQKIVLNNRKKCLKSFIYT